LIPVDQEFLHQPEFGLIGDCQRAVIASLLELPISEVPHFAMVARERDANYTGYWDDLQRWLGARGYAWLEAAKGSAFWGINEPGVFHEIAGPSPRGNGTTHAVVGRDGQIVFDPTPVALACPATPANGNIHSSFIWEGTRFLRRRRR